VYIFPKDIIKGKKINGKLLIFICFYGVIVWENNINTYHRKNNNNNNNKKENLFNPFK